MQETARLALDRLQSANHGFDKRRTQRAGSPRSILEPATHSFGTVPIHSLHKSSDYKRDNIYFILEPTDLELIERCLNRDQSAWEQIVARYKRKVFGIAYKFTGRFEEAEDLTQEVFLKVYKALDSYKKEQDFSWWLVSISRNACIDYYRSTKRERKLLSQGLDKIKEFKFEGLSPEGTMQAAERSKTLRRSLSELPDDLRTVLVLRDLKGMSYKEIADQLGLVEGTVKSRIHRGRAELAEKIKGIATIQGV